jgi:hypothetical protein
VVAALTAPTTSRRGIAGTRRARLAPGSQPAPVSAAAQAPGAVAGGQISWKQASLALGSLLIGWMASVSISTAGKNGTWPIIVIWIALVVINMAIFRAGRPFRRSAR